MFHSLGLNMTTAINIFFRQCVREGRIPFEITADVPNSKTVAAMLEAERLANDPAAKTYSIEGAIEELKS